MFYCLYFIAQKCNDLPKLLCKYDQILYIICLYLADLHNKLFTNEYKICFPIFIDLSFECMRPKLLSISNMLRLNTMPKLKAYSSLKVLHVH